MGNRGHDAFIVVPLFLNDFWIVFIVNLTRVGEIPNNVRVPAFE